MAGTRDVSGQEDDSDEVKKTFDTSVDTEFSFTMKAGSVVNDDFSDFKVLFGGEDGNETVKFTIEIEILNDGSAIGLEAAIDVVDGDAGKDAGKGINET